MDASLDIMNANSGKLPKEKRQQNKTQKYKQTKKKQNARRANLRTLLALWSNVTVV